MRGLLWRVAGVEPSIMKMCPGTDRVWAIQLGISLLFTFAFVFGLTFYSISYFIADPWGKLAASFLVASVVTLFDRALFQSDWFTVAALSEAVAPGAPRRTFGAALLRWAGLTLRLVARLSISLVIAYTLSLFAEIAVFGPAITKKLKEEHAASILPLKQRLDAFDQKYQQDVATLQSEVARLKAEEARLAQPSQGWMTDSDQKRVVELDAQIDSARAEQASLKKQIEQNDAEIKVLEDDIWAEENGKKTKPYHTGRKGCGPGSECVSWRSRRVVLGNERQRNADALGRKQDEIAGYLRDRQAIFDRTEQAKTDRRSKMARDVQGAEEALRRFQDAHSGARASMVKQLEEQGLVWQPPDDPIIRIRALHDLREDPGNASAVVQMSLLIKIFICFLEIAPVLAKMFFFPPTVYAALVKGMVVAGQAEAMRLLNPAPVPAPAPSAAAVPAEASVPAAAAASAPVAGKVEASGAEDATLAVLRRNVRDVLDGTEEKFLEMVGRRAPTPRHQPT